MNENALSRRWLRMAVLYFVVGVGLGIHMGGSGDHSLFPVHAHINLLGWVSMALFGLICGVYPAVAASRLATLHFWLHNVALPVMAVSLTLKLKGNPAVEPLLALSSAVVGVGALLFAWRVLSALRAPG